MFGHAAMENLRRLLGDDKFNQLAKPSRRPTGGSFALAALGPGWDEWRRVFDEAIGLMLPLLTPIDTRDRRKILASKLLNDFWSAVPEVFWAGRLLKLGWLVEVEPRGKGPDLWFQSGAVEGFLEVYSPKLKEPTFEIADDLETQLAKEEGSFHISLQQWNLNKREPQKVHALVRAIREMLRSLRTGTDRKPVRLNIGLDGTTSYSAIPEYLPAELDGDGSETPLPLLAIVDIHPDLGEGISIGATGQSGFIDPYADSAELLKGLGQLDRTKPNLLVLDASRQFIHDGIIGEVANHPAKTFEKHPELNAIIISMIACIMTEVEKGHHEDRFGEIIRIIPNPSPKFDFPADMREALKTGKRP